MHIQKMKNRFLANNILSKYMWRSKMVNLLILLQSGMSSIPRLKLDIRVSPLVHVRISSITEKQS